MNFTCSTIITKSLSSLQSVEIVGRIIIKEALSIEPISHSEQMPTYG